MDLRGILSDLSGEILKRAQQVAKPGLWLEEADLFLFCCKRSIDLQVIQNLYKFDIGTTSCALEKFEEMIGLPFPEKDRQVFETNTRKECIFLSAADFAPRASRMQLNHWAPCWSLDFLAGLGKDVEELAQDEAQRLRDVCAESIAKLDRRLAKLQSADDEDSDLLEEIIRQSMQREVQKLEDHVAAVERLVGEQKMLLRDVAKDGNCGIWSLIAFIQGPPFGNDHLAEMHDVLEFPTDESTKTMMNFRQILADMWESVAGDSWWQQCFYHFGLWVQEEEPDASEAGASNAHAPGTPTRSAKRKAEDWIKKLKNEHEPPKLTNTSRRCAKAGLVFPRPVKGPSVPMVRKQEIQESGSDLLTHLKVEPPKIPKKESKKMKKELVAGDAGELAEQQDQQEQIEKPKKKRRQQPSQEKKDEKFARAHLAKCGLANPEFVSARSQKALLRGAVDCKNGGWGELVKSLLRGDMPDKCGRCMTLMRSKPSFSLAAFQTALENFRHSCLTGLPDQLSAESADVGQSEKSGNTGGPGEAAQQPLPLPDRPGDPDGTGVDPEPMDHMDEEHEEDGAAAVQALLAQNPCLKVLEPNTRRKTVPVACYLCIRKSTGEPALFDAQRLIGI